MHRKSRRDRRRLRKLKAFLRTVQPVTVRPPGLDSQASESASDDDRLWFAEHPEVDWRLRPGIDGELGDSTPRWMVVLRFEPGQRVRIPLDETVSDEHARLMAENGRFDFAAGYPLWIPNEDGHRLVAEGKILLPDRWILLDKRTE